jgi:hypothetical protein
VPIHVLDPTCDQSINSRCKNLGHDLVLGLYHACHVENFFCPVVPAAAGKDYQGAAKTGAGKCVSTVKPIGIDKMNKLISEVDGSRLLCDGKQLFVEQGQGYDCTGKRRWLPASCPYDMDILNDLLRLAFALHYNEDGVGRGVVFCTKLNEGESMRIVHQPDGLHSYFECLEISASRDGLGEPIWYEVCGRSEQNHLLASALISLCAKG